MSYRIFISYRRNDSLAEARAIYERLRSKYGSREVFIDLDGISTGDDFINKISHTIEQCTTMLVVIGPSWEEAFTNKYQDPIKSTDYVHMEIEAATKAGLNIIPILIKGTAMPEAANLPNSICSISRINAFELDFKKFDSDTYNLINRINHVQSDNHGNKKTSLLGIILKKILLTWKNTPALIDIILFIHRERSFVIFNVIIGIIIVACGMIVRGKLSISTESIDTMWGTQGLLYFPTAIFLGTCITIPFFKNKMDSDLISKKSIVILFTTSYIVISYISSALFIIESGSFHKFDARYFYLPIVEYFSLFEQATAEFIIFIATTAASFLLILSKPLRFLSKITYLTRILSNKIIETFILLLCLASILLLIYQSTNNYQKNLSNDIRKELIRTGIAVKKNLGDKEFLLATESEAWYARAPFELKPIIEVAQNKLKLQVDGQLSMELFKKLNEYPSELDFSIGDKEDQFDSLEAALKYVNHGSFSEVLESERKRLNNNKIVFEISLAPGENLAPKNIYTSTPVRIKSASDNQKEKSTLLFTQKESSITSDTEEQVEIYNIKMQISNELKSPLEISGNISFKNCLIHGIENSQHFTISLTKKDKQRFFGFTNNSSKNIIEFIDGNIYGSGLLVNGESKVILKSTNLYGNNASVRLINNASAQFEDISIYSNALIGVQAQDNSNFSANGRIRFIQKNPGGHAVILLDRAQGKIINSQIQSSSRCFKLDNETRLDISTSTIGPCGVTPDIISIPSNGAIATITETRMISPSARVIRDVFSTTENSASVSLQATQLIKN